MGDSSVRRLLWFVGGLCLVLGGLEWVVRANVDVLDALSDRGRMKVAMFAQHPDAQFLILGSSRLEGAVSPVLVSRSLRRTAPELGEVRGFNAAFAGSSLAALTALVPRITFSETLRLVMIEISTAQLHMPAPQAEAVSSAVTIEDRLVAAVQQVQFVKYRKAYGYIGYVPALLFFGPRLSGWETKAKDQIASWRGREEEEARDFNGTMWGPEVISPSSDAIDLDARNEMLVERLVDVAGHFQKRGVTVVFVVPPLKRDLDAPEKGKLVPLFAEIARRTHCEVWNFAPRVLPDPLFRDASHLGDVGRAHYSQALAGPMARILTAQ